VDQFLLNSLRTLRKCGYLIATTHWIPSVADNKILDVSNWKRQQLNIF
jgi:hypothetical protein